MPNRDGTLSARDKRAIRALRRVAKNWPQDLTLLSWSGSLYVVPTNEADEPNESRAVSIGGIPNDGGDPDSAPADDGPDWCDTDGGEFA